MEATIVMPEFVDARVGPRGSLENLSQDEIGKLLDSSHGGLYALFRQCALAVLNSGADTDNAKEIFDRHRDFEIQIVPHAWGIKLEMKNAPASAFVDGEMIVGIKEHLFAVLRDVIYISNEIMASGRFDLNDPNCVTNAVFQILRNARLLEVKAPPNLVVCWGGHSIGSDEYKYTKKVGYEMGLRGLDVCTGCGPGAMKGPMKGATIGHAKQRILHGRYLGITEPGIIAAEPPNPIVSQLVIMPDIEKRLEAFVRLAHGIVVFPGGAGTAEEILYLAGILLDPANASSPFPWCSPDRAKAPGYFDQITRFIARHARQASARALHGDHRRSGRGRAPSRARHGGRARVSQTAQRLLQLQLAAVGAARSAAAVRGHARVDARTRAHRDQPVHRLAADLRRAFSGIVTGNVKEYGISAIERARAVRTRRRSCASWLCSMSCLSAFVAAGRMKLPGTLYRPCYRLVA